MIASFFQWLRHHTWSKPYDETKDDVLQAMRQATEYAREQTQQANQNLRVNRVEMAYLRRQVEPQNGGPDEGSFQSD